MPSDLPAEVWSIPGGSDHSFATAQVFRRRAVTREYSCRMPAYTEPAMSRPSLSVLARAADRVTASDADLIERFAGGDEAAFAALLRRHAALVRGVCRRLLICPHDADDAVQATFLVLARKAGSIDPQSLAGWLYGVAYHVALRARASACRRHQHEARVRPRCPADP